MLRVPESLQEYIEYISDGGDKFIGDFPLPESEDFYAAVATLFKSRLRRPARIRKIFAALNACGYAACKVVSFKPYFKVRAYMKDDGSVYFSLSHVLGAESGKLIKLVLHEAAHLWLSGQENYSKLKALDAAYTAKYGKSYYAAALSPVEYGAIKLSAALLERTSERVGGKFKEKLQIQVERERAKLSDLRAI